MPASNCLSLLAPYFNKGYNVATDNFFTSLNLAENLKSEGTIVGMMKKQRKEVPNRDQLMRTKLFFSSEIYKSPSGYPDYLQGEKI